MDVRTGRLLRWYDQNARTLPWRGIQDPYRTWVSEIMLQQTRVETVIGYYARFLEAFPTLEALAEADEADVLKRWEGLGYYSRARNLHQGAKQVMREWGGQLPADPAALRKIHGIGPYTAGAIASIAFGLPEAAVDGNVIRVVSRLYGVTDNLGEKGARSRVEALAAGLIPVDRPGDMNQAMMDLGAMVCVPGTPDCEICPLKGVCEAERKDQAADLPRLPKAKAPKELQYDLCLVYAGNRVLMRRRTEKMLQGLWCFPLWPGWKTGARRAEEIKSAWGWPVEAVRCEGEAKHVFTHQVWRMTLYEMDAPKEAEAPEGYTFIPLRDLDSLTLPTAMKAAKKLAQARWKALGDEG